MSGSWFEARKRTERNVTCKCAKNFASATRAIYFHLLVCFVNKASTERRPLFLSFIYLIVYFDNLRIAKNSKSDVDKS
jgi:hypothetical protein